MKTINNYIQEKLNLSEYTYKPKDKYELKKIIQERLKKDKNANLNDIDISSITDMRWLFKTLDPYNIDISDWDVSKVKNMRFMFEGCEKFNCDLSDWDVSKNTKITNMFLGCDSLKNTPEWY